MLMIGTHSKNATMLGDRHLQRFRSFFEAISCVNLRTTHNKKQLSWSCTMDIQLNSILLGEEFKWLNCPNPLDSLLEVDS